MVVDLAHHGAVHLVERRLGQNPAMNAEIVADASRQRATGTHGGTSSPLWQAPDVARFQKESVSVVATEQFVAAIAREGHRHLFAGQPGYQVGGNERGVGKRLVEVVMQLRQDIQSFGRGNNALMVIGAQMAGYLLGV